MTQMRLRKENCGLEKEFFVHLYSRPKAEVFWGNVLFIVVCIVHVQSPPPYGQKKYIGVTAQPTLYSIVNCNLHKISLQMCQFCLPETQPPGPCTTYSGTIE